MKRDFCYNYFFNLLQCFLLMVFALGCKEKQEKTLFELKQDSGVDFINKINDTDSLNILNYRNFYNGGGVAVGDINNDGLVDIFFTANQGANKLYLNQGNFKFKDISTNAGFLDKLQYSTGVVMVDINNDGWLDIYVCNAGSMHNAELRKNQLFINNKDLTFTEAAEKYGLANDGYSIQASFFDYDLDGDLDCFIINNSPIPVSSLGYPNQRELFANKWAVPENLKGGGDHLYRNDNGHFTEITQEAGIHGTLMSFGLGVTVGDVNGDFYPDIYVSNDFFERDYLYINQKNGKFKDEAEQWMQHHSYASMGADFGDINNDGYPDIFTTDMLPADDYRLKTTLSFDDIDQYRLKERNGFFNQFLQNTLQLNTTEGKFIDIANFSGVAASEWSWGALMFDADNDGWTDLYVCNGIYRDLTNQDFLEFDANLIKEKMEATGKKNLHDLVDIIPSIAVPNMLFKNMGNLQFQNKNSEWGLGQTSFSSGAAYADLDNDGDLDIVVNNTNEKAFVYQNRSRELNQNNFIGFDLKGLSNNLFAIGTKIMLYKDNQILSKEIIPSRGFQSSVEYKQIFGIGRHTSLDSIVIVWPNHIASTYKDLAINKVHHFEQPTEGRKIQSIKNQKSIPLLTLEKTNFEKHQENDFTDFYWERGIPKMLSAEGPKAAVGDINGDGRADIFIGGAKDQAGKIYLQQADGSFAEKKQPAFLPFINFEDGQAVFFDADKDGDLDLLITANGNEALPSSRELQHRMFLNDGKGNFSLQASAFSSNKDNIGTVVVEDFNKDGFLDVFFGASAVTQEYGLTPKSTVFINKGNAQFEELSTAKMDGLDKIGMVQQAIMVDVLNNGKKQLLVVGEWMSPSLYEWSGGKFTKIKTNLSDYTGWWQSVAVGDFNKDGFQDIALGNMGENFYLHPDPQAPLKLWINDFDKNGRADKILTRTTEGEDRTVFMKKEIQDELPSLKKQNLRHDVFARKKIQDLFTPEQLKSSQFKTTNTFSSIIAYGKGNGQFRVEKLPFAIQVSSVKAIQVLDIDKDGWEDMIIGGNEFNFQPQLGRLDANQGAVLLNKQGKYFEVLSNQQSGLQLPGMVRDIQLVHRKNKTSVLVLQNNEKPLLYNLP